MTVRYIKTKGLKISQVKGRIRIRIKVTSRIRMRIRIKVTSRIRIRINVIRIDLAFLDPVRIRNADPDPEAGKLI
jgi:hypothetical protein